MYADLSLKEYLKETASSTPVPGGGSVAALSASLAAALVEMVAGLTVGRTGFETVHAEMEEICRETAALRIRCIEDIDRDPQAYQKVLDAYRLPKESIEDKEFRTRSIQEAMKGAATVPLSLAENACRILSIADRIVKKGNKNAVTDGAVAAMMARAAGLAALYNVRINLTAIKDEDFVNKINRKVNSLEKTFINQENEILSQLEI
jgi:formiminotetrahydrofolate cyclodeaminase